jgi:hypothetical protein
VFVAAAALLLWFHVLPATHRADRRAETAGRALELAFERYARDHSGIYPDTGEVSGGRAQDALTRTRSLAFYPDNPYRPGRVMKNAPMGKFSPGDFSYMRNPDKSYEYSLIVYAGSPRGGPGRNGVIYARRQNP